MYRRMCGGFFFLESVVLKLLMQAICAEKVLDYEETINHTRMVFSVNTEVFTLMNIFVLIFFFFLNRVRYNK